MGWASGLQAGIQMGKAALEAEQRAKLQEAALAKPEEFQGYTADQGSQLEAAAKSGLYDIGMKQDEAGNFQGYTVTPKSAPDMQGLVAPGQVSEMYGQRYEGQLSPERVTGLRFGRMADIISETDPVKAQQLRAQQAEQEYQAQARPLALQAAQQQVTKGGLELADAQGMAKANQLFSDHLKNNNGKIDMATTMKIAAEAGVPATKLLEQNEAIRKGFMSDTLDKFSAAANKGVDGFNKFLAENFDMDTTDNIVPKVVQGKDGNFVVMYGDQVLPQYGSHKTFEELAIKAQGNIKQDFAGTAKTLMDIHAKREELAIARKNADSLDAYRRSAAEQGSNQIYGSQIGYMRDKNGNPVQVISGMRMNKKTGNVESVQVPLDNSVVPASALDPAKIAKQAEALVGTPIDPTNKKGPVHTEASAQQAVVDQIFNQFAGAGAAPGAIPRDDKSVADAIKAKAAGGKPGLSAQPAARDAQPVREAGESAAAYRQRLIAWDEARMQRESQAAADARQAQLRQNAAGLGSRPLMGLQ